MIGYQGKAAGISTVGKKAAGSHIFNQTTTLAGLSSHLLGTEGDDDDSVVIDSGSLGRQRKKKSVGNLKSGGGIKAHPHNHFNNISSVLNSSGLIPSTQQQQQLSET